MRMAHNFPGVVGVDIDLGHAEAPPHVAQALKAEGGSSSDKIVAYLRQHGPTKRVDIRKALHMNEYTINGAIVSLKDKGLIRTTGKAVYVLTEINGVATPVKQLALPKLSATNTGRVGQGQGPGLMLIMLQRNGEPMSRNALGVQMTEAGVPSKSVSGIVGRAVRDKLVKRTGAGNQRTLELTAKGQHEAEAAANG